MTTAANIETLAAEITTLFDQYWEMRDSLIPKPGPSREDSLTVGYNPRPGDVPRHSWWARVGRHEGYGDDAEMALLDLKSTLEGTIRESVESARKALAEHQARIEAMHALVTPSTPGRP